MWLKGQNFCLRNNYRTIKVNNQEVKCVKQLISVMRKPFHHIAIKWLKIKYKGRKPRKQLEGKDII